MQKKSRREFIKSTTLKTFSVAIGSQIAFGHLMPKGLIPLTMAGELKEIDEKTILKYKKGLSVLNDRPINAETPPHLLNDLITPTNRLFVRNNGLIPQSALNKSLKFSKFSFVHR